MILESFIPVPAESHFPIQNLPYGIFSHKTGDPTPRVGVAIGDQVLDLAVLHEFGVLRGHYFDQPNLNAFMGAGRSVWGETRRVLIDILRIDNPALRDNAELRTHAFVPMSDATLHLPAQIGDYTDFYASIEHATNVGIIIRGQENPLLPNYRYVPIAYHGRSSSVVLSGTDLHRPWGQIKPQGEEKPIFAPCRRMDFELEIGCFVGPGNTLGEPIPISEAMDHIFGMVLLNDWSARDIQTWEYQPLGPFLAKNVGTSISPWVVTLEALEPFRTAAVEQNPPALPYLTGEPNRAYDIALEALLQTPAMPMPMPISRTNFKSMYWTIAQQVAHHTSNGCNLRPSDLLGSGTISGSTPESLGSLLELAWSGTRPLQMPSGETRSFLEDGDRLTLTGWCQGDGYRVGFGEVTGKLLPAIKRD
jgi:fumarylacetoacetase